MNLFRDKIAIVTGGASGIGRALCQELGRREAASIVVADLNADGAHQVAAAINAAGDSARAAGVDVSQADAVQRLIQDTTAAHGRLDYMFNNAGISLVGEVRDMELAHWERLLEVNLWSVIYGTTMAYRVMVAQGWGHIVNTASATGLFPTPMGVAYTTTKSAIVGLSTALRVEAADLGVRVSVVCPGFIRTGLYDAMITVTRPKDEAFHRQVASLRMMDATACARAILQGVARNQAIIPVQPVTRVMWWLYRLQPSLFMAWSRRIARRSRAQQLAPPAPRSIG